jgi:hypothetical protein
MAVGASKYALDDRRRDLEGVTVPRQADLWYDDPKPSSTLQRCLDNVAT